MRNLFKEMPDYTCNHDLHKCSFFYKFKTMTVACDGFCTDERIADEDVPEGLFKYEVRSADDSEEWATLEKRVGVNHIATIIVDNEIFLAEHESGDFYNMIGGYDVDYGDDLADEDDEF